MRTLPSFFQTLFYTPGIITCIIDELGALLLLGIKPPFFNNACIILSFSNILSIFSTTAFLLSDVIVDKVILTLLNNG